MRMGQRNYAGPWKKTSMTCFIFHKINHLARECKNRSNNQSEDKNQFGKKKGPNDLKGNKTIEEVKNEMKKTWIKKESRKEGEKHSETKSLSTNDDSSSN